jgi:hypothetical protein
VVHSFVGFRKRGRDAHGCYGFIAFAESLKSTRYIRRVCERTERERETTQLVFVPLDTLWV